jgi:hypothetical protein
MITQAWQCLIRFIPVYSNIKPELRFLRQNESPKSRGRLHSSPQSPSESMWEYWIPRLVQPACVSTSIKRLAFMIYAFPYVHVPLRIVYACPCLLHPVQTADPVCLILCHYCNAYAIILSLFTWYRTFDL